MDFLVDLDRTLFDFIHLKLSNVFFDFYLPILRSKYTWIPVYIFIVSFVIWNTRSQRWIILLLLVTTIGVTDYTSSTIIKKNVKRVRPCNSVEMIVIPRVDCGSGFSFTSSHAANHSALSFFLIFVLVKSRRMKYLLVLWAALIAFAQVYVGVHYPSDVIAGGLLGIGFAILGSRIYDYSQKRIMPTNNHKETSD